MNLTEAVMLVKAKPGRHREIFETLQKKEGVRGIAMTTGPYDFVLFLKADNWGHMFDIIKSVRDPEGVTVTITLPVHVSKGFAPSRVSAIILTRVMRGDVDSVAENIYGRGKRINFSASVAGPYDVVLAINEEYAKDNTEISDIVIDKIQTFKEIKDTLTLTTGGKNYVSTK